MDAGAGPAERGRSAGTTVRRLVGSDGLTDGLALVVAWNFAVAQPLLDILGRNAAFFTAHASEPLDVVLLATGLTLLAPAALALAVWAVGRCWRPAGVVVHRAVLGVLAGLFGWQVVKRFGVPPAAVRWALIAAAGAGAVAAYRRWPAARSVARWLSPAPVVFLVLFLFLSPVAEVVRPAGAAPENRVVVRNPVPVVLVVLDELPLVSIMDARGEVDARTFPNFARLASTSTWYRNTTAVADQTAWAVPAILDGRTPVRARGPALVGHPDNLFTRLAGAYRVDAIEGVTSLCPPSACGSPSAGIPFRSRMGSLLSDTRVVAGHVLLPPPLADGLPPIDQGWAGFGASGDRVGAGVRLGELRRRAEAGDVQTPGARRRLAGHDPGGAVAAFASGFRADSPGAARPGLHFLHVQMPHAPWTYLPDGRRYPLPEPFRYPELDGLGWRDQPFADQGRARHLLQVRYTDGLLGVVLDELERTGLLDRSLVVVTADHGAAFAAGHARRVVDPGTTGDLAWVPLFVKLPGQHAAAVDQRPASTIDVMPTILDVIGAAGPAVDGRSLLGAPDPSRRRAILPDGGRPIDLPAGTGPRDDALVAAHRAVPGAPSDQLRYFRRGPYGALVGTRAPEAEPAGGLRARIEQPDRYRDVDAERGPVPVLLYGALEGSDDPSPEIVVAVDGVFAGSAYTFKHEGGAAHFTALLDPSAFRSGSNEIAVFVVSGPPDAPVLRRAR